MSRRPALSTLLAGAGALLLGVVVVVAAGQLLGREPDAPGSGPSASSRSGADDPSLPAPDGALPADPSGVARQLTAVTRRLRSEIERWVASGEQMDGPAPQAVELLALRQQRLYLRLSRDEEAAARAVGLLPDDVRAEARNVISARRALADIPEDERDPGEPPPPEIRTGPPAPAGQLRRFYTGAQRRFGVRWEVLAAVNLVESGFGRLRNASSAGAQGPMQFIPSTWELYGMGGEIDDPRDAILGAANYLAASGAPQDSRRALFAYNRSTSYVSAVLRHARAIERDPRHFYALYSWAVYAQREGQTKRLTGPNR
ncbi:MAG TPA: lytic transglycosylase domain-containing protein [Solirubrobacteraceae bacterium]|nr:lytic transglycosylase domain-containing protein [Solirubrobacteraceae bacterium]